MFDSRRTPWHIPFDIHDDQWFTIIQRYSPEYQHHRIIMILWMGQRNPASHQTYAWNMLKPSTDGIFTTYQNVSTIGNVAPILNPMDGWIMINIQKTMERSTMLFMGKSTISMAIFNSYICVFTRPGISSYIPLNPIKYYWITIESH